ncbi:MAG TPA: ABC transporter ATP-binding protein [Candidatus Binatia bacterium]|nr:ABC transporter ATP-binding protein [Candidatus Binatia bacterium]
MTTVDTTDGRGPAGGAPLLRTVELTRHFRLGGLLSNRVLHAVDDLTITIADREIVALVGESGSGKSTVARLLARLYRPTRGTIHYRGRSVESLRSRADILWYRGQVPMVFQDPYSSMNPVFRVSHGVSRNLRLHRRELGRAARHDEAERVFEAVGLTPAAEMLSKFPYEMSGGQRQRVGFAQALALRPRLILADEPVSMLDVSIRAGVLNLMADLRQREEVSILYITHDLASARYVADRILVMYAGHLVETGPTEVVLSQPKHPYTQLLLSAVPDPREEVSVEATTDLGEPPRVINPTEGCRFRFRCPLAIDECSRVTPRLRPMGPEHQAACHVATPDPATAATASQPIAPGPPAESV